MLVAWFWQQFRQGGKSETSVFVVLESNPKDCHFVDGNMKQNIQPIAVQENTWMWIKINYKTMKHEKDEMQRKIKFKAKRTFKLPIKPAFHFLCHFSVYTLYMYIEDITWELMNL